MNTNLKYRKFCFYLITYSLVVLYTFRVEVQIKIVHKPCLIHICSYLNKIHSNQVEDFELNRVVTGRNGQTGPPSIPA